MGPWSRKKDVSNNQGNLNTVQSLVTNDIPVLEESNLNLMEPLVLIPIYRKYRGNWNTSNDITEMQSTKPDRGMFFRTEDSLSSTSKLQSK